MFFFFFFLFLGQELIFGRCKARLGLILDHVVCTNRISRYLPTNLSLSLSKYYYFRVRNNINMRHTNWHVVDGRWAMWWSLAHEILICLSIATCNNTHPKITDVHNVISKPNQTQNKSKLLTQQQITRVHYKHELHILAFWLIKHAQNVQMHANQSPSSSSSSSSTYSFHQSIYLSSYILMTLNESRFFTTISYMCIDLKCRKSLGREMRSSDGLLWNWMRSGSSWYRSHPSSTSFTSREE